MGGWRGEENHRRRAASREVRVTTVSQSAGLGLAQLGPKLHSTIICFRIGTRALAHVLENMNQSKGLPKNDMVVDVKLGRTN